MLDKCNAMCGILKRIPGICPCSRHKSSGWACLSLAVSLMKVRSQFQKHVIVVVSVTKLISPNVTFPWNSCRVSNS